MIHFLFTEWVTENVYLETGTSAAFSSIKAYLTGWSGTHYMCNTLQISDTGHSDNVYNSSIVVGGNKQVKLEFSASQTTDLNTTATCTRDAPESDLTSPIYLDFIGKITKQNNIQVFHFHPRLLKSVRPML